MHAALEQFVRDALARGVSRDKIRAALTQARWRPEEIDAALARWAEVDFPVPVPRRDPALSAREAFLYLLLFATLYVAAFHTGAILFTMIERWLPDALVRSDFDPSLAGLRWSVAALLIALPVFLYTNRLIGRALAREPEKRASDVRRWLTYLTLFVAALVLIGDFVVVLRGLLAGELPMRFVSKAAVVAAIAGIAFRHYLSDLRRDEIDAPTGRASGWLGRVGVVGMLAVAVLGLVTVGTPRRARVAELDRRRVQNIQVLSNTISNYRTQNGRLPVTLDELAASPAMGANEWHDPQSLQPYEYTVVDSVRFDLCATFATVDSLAPWNTQPSDFWRHGVGRRCFRFSAGSAGAVTLGPY